MSNFDGSSAHNISDVPLYNIPAFADFVNAPTALRAPILVAGVNDWKDLKIFPKFYFGNIRTRSDLATADAPATLHAVSFKKMAFRRRSWCSCAVPTRSVIGRRSVLGSVA